MRRLARVPLVPLVALVALAALAGCDPYIYQQSVAPPGRNARLDEVTGFWGQVKRYRLEVSDGVALALTCNLGGPCEKLKAVSDNPAIAEVRPASLAALETVGYAPHGGGGRQQPASAFVVVGKAPGTTRIRVSAKEGKRTIEVTVVAPPAPTTTAVAAPVVSSRLLLDQDERAQHDTEQDDERERGFDGSQHVHR